MKKKSAKTYVVSVTVKSKNGKKPRVATFCGDTIFISLDEGQSAKWTVKEVK